MNFKFIIIIMVNVKDFSSMYYISISYNKYTWKLSKLFVFKVSWQPLKFFCDDL